VRIELERCIIREWSPHDARSLVAHADNRNIWINLRDRFPHPYRVEDAERFLDHTSRTKPPTVWAIEVDRHAVGGIGVEPLSDVERVSGEIGYWLGEKYWGRGIVTDAVRAVTQYAFREFDLTRIFALPFADNAASIRVLEKAGYVLEGRLLHSAIKDGVIRDQLMYAAYRPTKPGGRVA
jgi:[ribosomal protein S5]-alanine N-acetyltransferase